MNALTFDFTNGNVIPPKRDQSEGVSGSFKMVDPYSREPRARASDPSSSREAAAVVKPGNGALIAAIRTAASKGVPATAFVIAARVEHVHPKRWDEGSIRSAISRAGLRAVDVDGRSPRGHRCCRYSV